MDRAGDGPGDDRPAEEPQPEPERRSGADDLFPPPPGALEVPSTFPSRSWSPAIVALALALAVSLLANGILATKLRTQEDRIAGLERELTDAQAQIETLRGTLREGDGGPIERIAAATAALRGLEFTEPVEPEVLTTAALRERILEQFAEDADPEELAATGALLQTLGLVRAGYDFGETLERLQAEQVAGYYDAEEKTLVVAGDPRDPSPFDAYALSHEFVHALTDQHFGLGRLEELSEAAADDEAAAFLALVEGDATLTSTMYVQQVMTAEEQRALGAQLGRVPQDEFERAPAAVQRFLLFPYDEGLTFARRLFERGGFALIDQAYADPPASTEQILHPSRYYATRDEPQAVSMPDLAAALGGAWETAIEAGLGEFDLRVILDECLPTCLSKSDAEAGADGWDGGRYQVLRAGDRTVVAFSTVWDSESEAREAGRAFERWLPLRYRNTGNEFDVPGGGVSKGWESSRGAGAVVREGDRLLVIVGPDARTVRRVRDAF